MTAMKISLADQDFRAVEVSISEARREPHEEPRVSLQINANFDAFELIRDEAQAACTVRIDLNCRAISALAEVLRAEAAALERETEDEHQRQLARIRDA